MKISKLFHWLYATLMFLPLIFFVPSAFYYGLNEHASNTETTTINYKYESNEVNSLSDLVEGNIYHLNIENTSFDSVMSFSNDGYIVFTLLNVVKYDFNNVFEGLDEVYLNSYLDNGAINVFIYCDSSYNANLNFTLVYNETNDYFADFILDLTNNFTLECDFLLNTKDSVVTLDTDFITITDYNVIESVSVNTDDTISNKMYLAWESLWDLPVFSWTKTCFLSAGFTYISGLFGVSATNSLNYVFGYWITISICWLVFDLLIYVPNLAHRWLDKGALE